MTEHIDIGSKFVAGIVEKKSFKDLAILVL